MAFSAKNVNTNALGQPINEVGHGFGVGHAVRFNGAGWVKALADSLANSEGAYIVSSVVDANNFVLCQEGYIVGLTTGPYVAGTTYYLSPSVAGALTSTAPSAVGEVVRPIFYTTTTTAGFVMAAQPLVITYVEYDSLGPTVEPSAYGYAVGFSEDEISAVVTSDGATITLTLENNGGGDITVLFDGGPITVDCTPALTAALTAGTATVPVTNYAYVLQSAPTVITLSTVGFPAGVEFFPVGEFICADAATVQAYGTYSSKVCHNNLTNGGSENGYLHFVSEWIREQPAHWASGCALTPTLTPGAPDTLTIAIATGTVLQLKSHTFPAFDSSVGSGNLHDFFVVNDNTAAYSVGQDLYNWRELDDGTPASNNDIICWVVWGVASESSDDCKVMINLPSGFYKTAANAIDDSSRYSNYIIPADYEGSGFLIARLVYQYSTGGGGTLTLIQQDDLRGAYPNSTAGGTSISGATTELNNLATTSINASLLVDTDGAYDLGSTGNRWRVTYSDDLTLTNPLVHEYGGLEANVSAYAGMILINGGATTEVKMNWAAAAGPTVNDDSGAGYVIGSRWIDTALDNEYVCLDNTLTAAVWKLTT